MNRHEQTFQISVVNYLRLVLPEDAIFFSVPNGGFRTKAEAGIMKATGQVAGVGDLIFVYRGKAHAIELKAPKAYQSPSQRAWQAAFERAGGQYAICRTLDELDAILARWSVHVRARRAA